MAIVSSKANTFRLPLLDRAHELQIDIAVSRPLASLSKWKNGHRWSLDLSCAAPFAAINHIFQTSDADYCLLIQDTEEIPDIECILEIIESGVDFAHSGLLRGTGDWWPDLYMVIQDWDMINVQTNQKLSNWRASFNRCLIRKKLFLDMGGLDKAFASVDAAFLELSFRSEKMGGLVEYRPELGGATESLLEPPPQDFYTFVIRHFGQRWANYLFARRCLKSLHWHSELRSLRRARERCASVRADQYQPVWYANSSLPSELLHQQTVSVIIPTLGRYSYLGEALDSIRRQTLKPHEVIIVDQNAYDSRHPELYENYHDLNLKVVWQDEKGQSLARNSGISVASGRYVLLFDDDSIAQDDLIESHLRMILGGKFHVSTGVSYSPKMLREELPPGFRFPRTARTFDTGNAMLPKSIVSAIGGLDRNYDFGTGTDLDYGTRLYLSGCRIAHNPFAIRIHFKAPMGGLRVHGAHKYNSDFGLFHPFPPITQTYYAMKYLSKYQLRERAFLQYITNRFPKELRARNVSPIVKAKLLVKALMAVPFLPLKWRRSLQHARKGILRSAAGGSIIGRD
jgi:glycosyltransferase involved in cell wall biosynthesis